MTLGTSQANGDGYLKSGIFVFKIYHMAPENGAMVVDKRANVDLEKTTALS